MNTNIILSLIIIFWKRKKVFHGGQAYYSQWQHKKAEGMVLLTLYVSVLTIYEERMRGRHASSLLPTYTILILFSVMTMLCACEGSIVENMFRRPTDIYMCQAWQTKKMDIISVIYLCLLVIKAWWRREGREGRKKTLGVKEKEKKKKERKEEKKRKKKKRKKREGRKERKEGWMVLLSPFLPPCSWFLPNWQWGGRPAEGGWISSFSAFFLRSFAFTAFSSSFAFGLRSLVWFTFVAFQFWFGLRLRSFGLVWFGSFVYVYVRLRFWFCAFSLLFARFGSLRCVLVGWLLRVRFFHVHAHVCWFVLDVCFTFTFVTFYCVAFYVLRFRSWLLFYSLFTWLIIVCSPSVRWLIDYSFDSFWFVCCSLICCLLLHLRFTFFVCFAFVFRFCGVCVRYYWFMVWFMFWFLKSRSSVCGAA